MLRALAARRVGNVPENVTVHYVSQEVNLSEAKQEMLPAECVVEVRYVVTLDGQDEEVRPDHLHRNTNRCSYLLCRASFETWSVNGVAGVELKCPQSSLPARGKRP